VGGIILARAILANWEARNVRCQLPVVAALRSTTLFFTASPPFPPRFSNHRPQGARCWPSAEQKSLCRASGQLGIGISLLWRCNPALLLLKLEAMIKSALQNPPYIVIYVTESKSQSLTRQHVAFRGSGGPWWLRKEQRRYGQGKYWQEHG
jgi:hypothetical protein